MPSDFTGIIVESSGTVQPAACTTTTTVVYSWEPSIGCVLYNTVNNIINYQVFDMIINGGRIINPLEIPPKDCDINIVH